MKDCLFCQFTRKPPEQGFVYEDDNFVAFLDICQLTKGHTLVIPKKHYRWVWDLPSEALAKEDVPNIGQYFQVCQKVANRMQEIYQVEQIYTLTMGSMIPHAHIHLIPKTKGNWHKALSTIWQFQENRADFQKLKETTKRLKFA